ncbi:MAG: PqqD family peptide modification chaperone [Ilumatobacteraceae bacterium]|nr:PqqD family peptide modification chaperone [Ilumatobacteraceae bacterium]
MTAEDNNLPTKVAGMETNDVADGMVVFDPVAKQVHYLNNTASIVYELCGGETNGAGITEQAAQLLPNQDWATQVSECLDDLQARGLIR